MNICNKIVTYGPLQEIQLGNGMTIFERISDLTRLDLKSILRFGSVQFIVANIGDKLKIIDTENCFDFWKREVARHLADPFEKIDLDCYPDNYAYFASEWKGQASFPIILLEKVH